MRNGIIVLLLRYLVGFFILYSSELLAITITVNLKDGRIQHYVEQEASSVSQQTGEGTRASLEEHLTFYFLQPGVVRANSFRVRRSGTELSFNIPFQGNVPVHNNWLPIVSLPESFADALFESGQNILVPVPSALWALGSGRVVSLLPVLRINSTTQDQVGIWLWCRVYSMDDRTREMGFLDALLLIHPDDTFSLAIFENSTTVFMSIENISLSGWNAIVAGQATHPLCPVEVVESDMPSRTFQACENLFGDESSW